MAPIFARAAAPHFTTIYLGRGIDQAFFIWCLVWWPVVAGFVIIFDMVRMGISGGNGALWFCELTANSIGRLAIKCGIDSDGLRRTIADYNRVAENKATDPLDKSPDYLQSLGDGPYYALNAAISNRFA